jgi:hypothetical protein
VMGTLRLPIFGLGYPDGEARPWLGADPRGGPRPYRWAVDPRMYIAVALWI